MIEIKLSEGWVIRCGNIDTIVNWLEENVGVDNWDFKTKHPLDKTPTMTFRHVEDAELFVLLFGR